jgi:uncharacterized membrane protein YqjE
MAVVDNDPRSAARLVVDSVDHFSKLLRSEMAVARAEFGEKVSEAVTGAAAFAIAGLLLIPVMVVAMLALAAWLVEIGLRPSLAHGAAALAGLVIVGAIALFGKSKFGPSTFAMDHTQAELKQDAKALKRVM